MVNSPSFENFHIITSSPLSTCCLGIALILSLILGGSSNDKTSHFYPCIGPRSKSDNFISTSLCVKGPSISSLKELPLIQQSDQSFILSPFLTPQQIPSTKVWKPALIALQFGDAGSLSGSLAVLLSTEQYFLKITFIKFLFCDSFSSLAWLIMLNS